MQSAERCWKYGVKQHYMIQGTRRGSPPHSWLLKTQAQQPFSPAIGHLFGSSASCSDCNCRSPPDTWALAGRHAALRQAVMFKPQCCGSLGPWGGGCWFDGVVKQGKWQETSKLQEIWRNTSKYQGNRGHIRETVGLLSLTMLGVYCRFSRKPNDWWLQDLVAEVTNTAFFKSVELRWEGWSQRDLLNCSKWIMTTKQQNWNVIG